MKNKIKKIKEEFIFYLSLVLILITAISFIGCKINNGNKQDLSKTYEVTAGLSETQPTPTDLDFSLERYNLIRRAYWVNGQREKAMAVTCSVQKPLGYITLITNNGAVVGSYTVDGKVSSLNSFLTPDSRYYSYDSMSNVWIADVDGSYGENDKGIFFFTVDGNYIEWTGTYIYSDIPMHVENPVIKMEVGK